jgi:hypothetical protein
MCIIHIGGEHEEFIQLTFRGYSHPGSEHYRDRNWINCTARAQAGAFQGQLDNMLLTDELERFRTQVARLYAELTGEAALHTMEHWLCLRLIGDGRGHVELRCRLLDHPVFGNSLDFRLNIDQTFLPALLRQLEAVLQRFPVVGRAP